MDWYNQSFQNYSIRNVTGYLVYIATKTYHWWGKNEMPGDIAVDSISDY